MIRFLLPWVLLSVIAIPSLSSAETLELRTLNNPPLEFVRDGKVVGIAVDLAREAIRRTGNDVNIEIRPWKRVLREAKLGTADGAINAGRSEQREQWGLYPQEALIDEIYVLFSHRPIALPANFDGVENLRLGSQLGYYYGPAFANVVMKKRFKSVETAQTIQKNLQKLLANRTDVFIGDYLPTYYNIHKMGLQDKIHPVTSTSSDNALIISTSPTYVAFSKKNVNPAYVKKFSAALREMKKDGTYDHIVRSYMP